MRESEGKKQQRYFKPKRELFKKHLAHMLIDECLTNREIAAKCNTSIKNVERWISEYYREKNQELANLVNDEQVLTAANRARDRIERHKQSMLAELESDKYKDTTSLRERIEYWNLILQLEMADYKFLLECPAELARRKNGLSLLSTSSLPKGFSSLGQFMAMEGMTDEEILELEQRLQRQKKEEAFLREFTRRVRPTNGTWCWNEEKQMYDYMPKEGSREEKLYYEIRQLMLGEEEGEGKEEDKDKTT